MRCLLPIGGTLPSSTWLIAPPIEGGYRGNRVAYALGLRVENDATNEEN